MSLTHINFDWSFYFSMLALITLWNCGFVAITRQGKIMYFIQEWFDRSKEVLTPFGEEACMRIDAELLALISKGGYNEVRAREISDYMRENKILSESSHQQILKQITERGQHNLYYYKKEVPRFPSFVKDPIVTCITCMASFHSLLLYTMVTVFLGFSWNPFEWVILAIPAAFTGEFMWTLKEN